MKKAWDHWSRALFNVWLNALWLDHREMTDIDAASPKACLTIGQVEAPQLLKPLIKAQVFNMNPFC